MPSPSQQRLLETVRMYHFTHNPVMLPPADARACWQVYRQHPLPNPKDLPLADQLSDTPTVADLDPDILSRYQRTDLTLSAAEVVRGHRLFCAANPTVQSAFHAALVQTLNPGALDGIRENLSRMPLPASTSEQPRLDLPTELTAQLATLVAQLD